MSKSCKLTALLIYIGGLCLPVFATEKNWYFGSKQYNVNYSIITTKAENIKVKVNLTTNKKSDPKQLKKQCRGGLNLPLRQLYEDILLKQNWIISPRSTKWPQASVDVILQDISYEYISDFKFICSAKVTELKRQEHIENTAFQYALYYWKEKKWASLRKIAPYLLKSAHFAFDTAGLINLMLFEIGSKEAKLYFNKHIKQEKINYDIIRIELAEWLYEIDNKSASWP